MKRKIQTIIYLSMFFILAGVSSMRVRAATLSTVVLNPPPSRFALIAWNDVGMHCMDFHYPVFAILPPYNNLHAQLVDVVTGKPVSTGAIITYEAVYDTHGSINTYSSGKTDFWDYVFKLFGVSPPPNFGLADHWVQSLVPRSMDYDATYRYWKADGIPTVPYDDAGNANYYPMVKVVARDWTGIKLAETKTVLPVSDELACSNCHASGSDAQQSSGSVNDADPNKDWKRNILLLHDYKNASNPVYVAALDQLGYSADGLLATSDSGTPILCANCHASNALGKPGVSGVKQLTTSIHSWHAENAKDDATGLPLGDTMDRTGCYYCHPGSTTQCLRGAMGSAKNPDGTSKLECQSCHGSMYKVGEEGRQGWMDLPKCQNCHYKADDGTYVRDTSALDASGNFKQRTGIFSTGGGLYKLSATHGMRCESCHGSTHCEYPSTEPNDNVQSIMLQGYAGMVAECRACHVKAMPFSDNGGPHGLHTIGQLYVNTHFKAAPADPSPCKVCHGTDLKGTVLSKTFTDRSFTTTGQKKQTYAKGDIVGCYDPTCHKRFGQDN